MSFLPPRPPNLGGRNIPITPSKLTDWARKLLGRKKFQGILEKNQQALAHHRLLLPPRLGGRGGLALLLALSLSSAAHAEPKTLQFEQTTAAYKGRDSLAAWTGTTKEVSGTLAYDSQTGEFLKGEVQVGLASIDSGNSVRDARMRNEFLQTDKFPTALFVVKKVEDFPKFSDWKQWGNRQKGRIIGDLTIKNVTKPVTFEAETVYTGKELKVTGTSKVKMTDFGITPPSIFLVTVEDTVGLEFNAVAKQMP